MGSFSIQQPLGRSAACYAHSPGPRGHNDGGDPDRPRWLIGNTPGSNGCRDAGDPTFLSIPTEQRCIAVFGLKKVRRFVQGVAFWRVLHRHLNVTFKPEEGAFWKTLDKAIFWTDLKIGLFEANTGPKQQTEREVNELANELLDEFFEAAERGPESVSAWWRQQEQMRKACEDGYARMISAVAKSNAGIAEAMRAPLRVLLTAKAAADLTAAGIGTYGGWGGTAFSVGYTWVTVTLEEMSRASALAVIEEEAAEEEEGSSGKAEEKAAKDLGVSAVQKGAEVSADAGLKKAERELQRRLHRAEAQMKSHAGQVKREERRIRNNPNRSSVRKRAYESIRQHTEKQTAAYQRATKAAAGKAAVHTAGGIIGGAIKHAAFLWLAEDIVSKWWQEMDWDDEP